MGPWAGRREVQSCQALTAPSPHSKPAACCLLRQHYPALLPAFGELLGRGLSDQAIVWEVGGTLEPPSHLRSKQRGFICLSKVTRRQLEKVRGIGTQGGAQFLESSA